MKISRDAQDENMLEKFPSHVFGSRLQIQNFLIWQIFKRIC